MPVPGPIITSGTEKSSGILNRLFTRKKMGIYTTIYYTITFHLNEKQLTVGGLATDGDGWSIALKSCLKWWLSLSSQPVHNPLLQGPTYIINQKTNTRSRLHTITTSMRKARVWTGFRANGKFCTRHFAKRHMLKGSGHFMKRTSEIKIGSYKPCLTKRILFSETVCMYTHLHCMYTHLQVYRRWVQHSQLHKSPAINYLCFFITAHW